jgi:hypothetical protein
MRDIGRNVMHSVKMNRKELLKIVKENKVKHVAEFTESVQDYINAVVKITKANLKLANTTSLEEIAKIRNLPQKPMSYEDNYTRAIRMLELSVEDTIEVEEHIFNQLVLDEWGWKQAFTASAALYKSI